MNRYNQNLSDPDFLKACARVQKLRTATLFSVHFANRSFVERPWSDPVYVAARMAMDDVLLGLAEAKWLFGQIDGTNLQFAGPVSDPGASLAMAERGFRVAIAECNRIKAACERGVPPDRGPSYLLTIRNETRFYNKTPVVPTICPVVVVQGSNADMGRQYAQQVIEIYGGWIFARLAEKELSESEVQVVSLWEDQLRQHMPEVLEFARGWAEGACGAGVPLSYLQALAVWTGVRPPVKECRPMAFAQTEGNDERITAAYLGVAADKEISDFDLCSGIFAWGRGTKDGSVIAGSTTDHDCTFQATIVAFPNEGHPFIYTPFSANGSIPVIGDFHMAGHPGMNANGLAYVHHGGANTGEPVDQWGYGVRRGPATFHALQFCDDAIGARNLHRRYPVGDAGISLGTVGGMFGDAQYGFSLEARSGAPVSKREIIREKSYDAYGRDFDFLYANNNAMALESGHLNVPPPAGYRYSIAGGWFTLDWAEINVEPGPKAFRRHNTRSSEGRNRYAYRMMMEGYGNVDLDYMKMVYRQSGEMPAGTLADIQARWEAGEPWNSSTAHRGNAFTAVMNPRRGEDGVYLGCIGPANRAVQPRGPEHGYYYHDETNAFWELRLRRNPLAMLAEAAEVGRAELTRARQAYSELVPEHTGRKTFRKWIEEAELNLSALEENNSPGETENADIRLARIARMLRRCTRAQVRARQVIEAIYPPPTWAD